MKEVCARHDDGCFGEQCEICKAWTTGALFRKEVLHLDFRKKAIVACCFLTKWFAVKSMGPCMEILKSERKPTEAPDKRGGMLSCDKCNVGCKNKIA